MAWTINSTKNRLAIIYAVLVSMLGLMAILLVFLFATPSSSPSTLGDTEYNNIPILPEVARDVIPALDNPRFVSAASSESWLKPEEFVIGVRSGNTIKAYPLKIMNYHESINDRVGELDVLVSYSPVCRSAAIYDRSLNGETLNFGNSGALYEGCSVLYDKESESFWWQNVGKSIRGDKQESQLRLLASSLLPMRDWVKIHPDTLVLDIDTGYFFDYLQDPYFPYADPEAAPTYPIKNIDERAPPRTLVTGIEVDGVFKAYDLETAKNAILEDVIEGHNIEVVGNKTGDGASVYKVVGDERTLLPNVNSYWFAWAAAHPDSELVLNQK